MIALFPQPQCTLGAHYSLPLVPSECLAHSRCLRNICRLDTGQLCHYLLIYYLLRGRERQRHRERHRVLTHWFTSQMPAKAGGGWGRAGAKARSQKCNLHLPYGGQEPNSLDITTASQSLHWPEAGVRSQRQEWNPGTPVWEAGILTTRLNAQSPP